MRTRTTNGAQRYKTITHAIRGPVRSVPLLHAFSRPPPARHFAAQYLCTVSICRYYHIDLPPNLCRLGGKLPPFPRSASVVPARHLSVAHMDGTTSPCRGKAQTTDHVPRSLRWIFTCAGAGNATSPFICGYEAIPAPGKAVSPVGATESRCGRRSRAGCRVRSVRQGGRRASRRTVSCGECRSSAPAVRALPAAPS